MAPSWQISPSAASFIFHERVASSHSPLHVHVSSILRRTYYVTFFWQVATTRHFLNNLSRNVICIIPFLLIHKHNSHLIQKWMTLNQASGKSICAKSNIEIILMCKFRKKINKMDMEENSSGRRLTVKEIFNKNPWWGLNAAPEPSSTGTIKQTSLFINDADRNWAIWPRGVMLRPGG